MRVSSAAFSDLDDLADLWVELAADQRAFGSHLRADANRTPIREALARHVAADGVLVAREGDSAGGTEGGTEGETGAGSDTEAAGAGGLVGFVMFDIEAGAYEQDVTRGMIRNLFVRPSSRDAGVGTRLLEAAENALGAAGADTVALDVLAANDAARRFYRRHGYRPHRVELEKSMRSDTHSKEDG
ncbi:GNAT family N-acetyltransferase [Haloferax sulfurifontis]|uniref:Sporulation regulator-like protein n=2 Tax=Haloferax sulfurifontis TaxID=255616 RepID=M0IU09_9EURY|nr:GNAT family N-acetyltransferase [Haloferax sulfurifontis]ELZ99308.1 sporulation regulator-like protein [Haloferax sulfurifontis ATCC BAA-897]GGC43113.1 GNAT family N-acetyltransferase [Haloferax sulfurifontis]